MSSVCVIMSAKQKKAMKWLTIGGLLLVLSGCGMTHEEYTARVEYCTERGMEYRVFRLSNGRVDGVRCVNEEGHEFGSSRGGKK